VVNRSTGKFRRHGDESRRKTEWSWRLRWRCLAPHAGRLGMSWPRVPHGLPMTSHSWMSSEFERGRNRGTPWACRWLAPTTN